MGMLGMGVMIKMLGDSRGSVEAYIGAIGKTIAGATVKDDACTLRFTDGTAIRFRDDGQDCCERRYMVCDYDLTKYVGATFTRVNIKDAPEVVDEWGDTHEVQFLEVLTSAGEFTVANHNEHDGYYGGFFIVAESC